MADDDKKEPEQKNSVTIPIEEYNRLKAKDGHIQKLETDVESYKAANAQIASELEEVKKQKIKTPDRAEIEESIRKELGEKLTAAEQRALENERKYKSAVVTDRVLAELQKEGLKPWAGQYVKAFIEKECDLDGDQIIIRDEHGNPRYSSVKLDQKMDISEYNTLIKSRQPEFFESTTRSSIPEGSGEKSGSSSSGAKSMTWAEAARLDKSDLTKIANENPALLDELMRNTAFKG